MITEELSQVVARALERAIASSALPPAEVPRPLIERPRDASYGDYATNVALVTAGRFNLKKEQDRLAQIIVAHIEEGDRALIESITVTRGFINFRLSLDWLRQNLAGLLQEGPAHGRGKPAMAERIQVEFVSANPTGPLSVGHARQGALGSAIASLLEATGHQVEREFYINDFGNQVDLLGRSVHVRYLQVRGQDVQLPEDGYQGEYVTDVARRICAEEQEHGPDRWLLNKPEDEARVFCREFALQVFLDDQREVLADFGVRFDVWYSERQLHEQGGVQAAVDDLRTAGHVYDQDGATWFRSTSFGDNRDRVLVRSDGRPTYLAGDIAYHRDKYARGFDRLINVWGADHHGDVPGLRGALRALGHDDKRLEVVLHQMVNLYRGEEMVRMSKRTGELVTLRELMDEVGRDAVRFFLLLRSADNKIDFDLELAKQESSDNPVYYVQMAHARVCSVFAKAREGGLDPEGAADLSRLGLPEERKLLFVLTQYPHELGEAARLRDPARLVRYLLDLATDFHSYYNLGNLRREDRLYVPGDDALSLARLRLAEGVRTVLADALENVLGISAPVRMDKLDQEAVEG